MDLRNGSQQKFRRTINFALFLTLVATLLPVDVGALFDYCSVKQCKNHIACNNDGDFSENCPPSVDLIQMSEFKVMILKWYNHMRERVASGQTHLKPAARMGAMAWDDELANLAEMNVKRCRLGSDRCHPTEDYVYSGQNVGQFEWSGAEFMDQSLIKQRINAWMKALPQLNMTIINKFPARLTNPSIGHLTAIITDRNNRVGCSAIIMTVQKGTRRFILACNYASTNLIDEPVYLPGKPASKCKKGRHKEYKSLCAISEDYQNNKL